MDLTSLQQAWALPGPWQVSTLAHGTNNQVLRLETPAGSYVLRVYSNHADPGRLRFEHTVLAHLQAAELPFAVPVPIPTKTGETFARVVSEDDVMLAALTALIPGEQPQRDNLQQATAAGEALGRLDVALAQVPLCPHEGIGWRTYGDLAHCHPLVPDPLAAIKELPIEDDVCQRLRGGYEWLMRHIPGIYARLPQQLAHEDCGPDNMLLEGERVTGVLDFEFCTRDLRVMDLTVALSWWPVRHFGTGDEWPIIRALVRGYTRHIALTLEEIEVIPTLFQLRAYTSLIHRLGRYRQGLSPLEAVIERASAALEREDWLQAHGARLAQMVRDAASASISLGER